VVVSFCDGLAASPGWSDFDQIDKSGLARNLILVFYWCFAPTMVQKAAKGKNEVKWSKIVEICCSLMKIVED